MHTPRMNFRQSMSLNEAVMEAMMGKKPMQADLEKMSGDEREILRKHFQAYTDNPREVEKLVVQAAVEDGRITEDIEEEARPWVVVVVLPLRWWCCSCSHGLSGGGGRPT